MRMIQRVKSGFTFDKLLIWAVRLFLTNKFFFGCGRTVEKQKSGQNKQAVEPKFPGIFPIVGVGASAGGLEAFRALLEFLPVDTGLAFVIIQHLAAGQESLLTDILSRFTKMPVHQVEDEMHVEPTMFMLFRLGQP
jgi:chemotaxis response regulator CheB